jgi:hypothetical protein
MELLTALIFNKKVLSQKGGKKNKNIGASGFLRFPP